MFPPKATPSIVTRKRSTNIHHSIRFKITEALSLARRRPKASRSAAGGGAGCVTTPSQTPPPRGRAGCFPKLTLTDNINKTGLGFVILSLGSFRVKKSFAVGASLFNPPAYFVFAPIFGYFSLPSQRDKPNFYVRRFLNVQLSPQTNKTVLF